MLVRPEIDTVENRATTEILVIATVCEPIEGSKADGTC